MKVKNRIFRGRAVVIFCMAFMLMMTVFMNTPVQAATSISEEEVYERMIAQKANYPEGMRWTNDNTYRLSVPVDGVANSGAGCAAFGFILSDAGFGKGEYPARRYYEYDNIRVGDILRINNDTHSVVVLSISGDVVTIAEGNYNSSIHWDRTLSLSALQNGGIDFGITRYPVEYSQDTSGTCGDGLTWSLSDSGVLTIKGAGKMKNYSGREGQEAPWHVHTANIKKVVIESGVTSIGDCAFSECSQLTDVQIPSTVTSLGADAFYMCESLKAIVLPNSITEVGNYTFYGCAALEDVTLSNNLITISRSMFAQCKALKELEIPKSVTAIAYCAFNASNNLNYLYIPNTVTTVVDPYQTFNGIAILCEDNAPVMQYAEEIEYLCPRSEWSGNCGTGLDYNFDYDTRTLTLIGNGNASDANIFDGYQAVKYIVLKDFNATELPTYFYKWDSVENFEIPGTVTKLDYNTFADCDSLQYVVVPKSVTDIRSSFWGNSDNFVIRGYKGSKVETYAAQQGILFEALKEDVTLPDNTPVVPEDSTSIPEFGWCHKGGKSYWYEGSRRQGTYDDPQGVLGDGTVRGREIYDSVSDGWYWLDAVYEGAKAVNKEVWMPYIYQGEQNWPAEEIAMNAANSGDMAEQVIREINNRTGKWVRYDENGKMYKGWYTVEGADAQIYPDQVGNTYYYDYQTGLMAKGQVEIDGQTYYFDEITGVLQK